MKGGKLTDKQQRFVDEYLVDLNATKAAIRAGYSARTAEWQGPQLLTVPRVADAIHKRKQERSERVQITADEVVRELRRIAFSDPREVMEWGPGGVKLKPSCDLTDDAAASLAELTESTTLNGGSLKIKKHDKVKALELLGRHLGLFDSDSANVNINAGRGAVVRVIRERKAPATADE